MLSRSHNTKIVADLLEPARLEDIHFYPIICPKSRLGPSSTLQARFSARHPKTVDLGDLGDLGDLVQRRHRSRPRNPRMLLNCCSHPFSP
jgi:hypothetical protein